MQAVVKKHLISVCSVLPFVVSIIWADFESLSTAIWIDSCGPLGSEVYISIFVSYLLLFGVVAFILSKFYQFEILNKIYHPYETFHHNQLGTIPIVK